VFKNQLFNISNSDLPDDLRRTVISRSGQLIFAFGSARDEWRDLPATVPTTFAAFLKTLPKDAQWALRDVNLTDDGLTIAQAIRDGTAIGISDGSFKDGFGTVSWMLEGSSPRHRIRGDNIVAGDTADQGSYRSELSGLYGITMGVYALCEFYKIDQGAIEVGCDGITALERGFEESNRRMYVDSIPVCLRLLKLLRGSNRRMRSRKHCSLLVGAYCSSIMCDLLLLVTSPKA
jgi:hypothetical protein